MALKNDSRMTFLVNASSGSQAIPIPTATTTTRTAVASTQRRLGKLGAPPLTRGVPACGCASRCASTRCRSAPRNCVTASRRSPRCSSEECGVITRLPVCRNALAAFLDALANRADGAKQVDVDRVHRQPGRLRDLADLEVLHEAEEKH